MGWLSNLFGGGRTDLMAALKKEAARSDASLVVGASGRVLLSKGDAVMALQMEPMQAEIAAGEDARTVAAHHVGGALRTLALSHELGDFASIRPLLRIRLQPAELRHGGLVVSEAFEGASAFLAIDRPDAVLWVQEAHAASWGVDRDELFRIALDNTVAEGDLELRSASGPDGLFTACAGDGLYASANALALDTLGIVRSPHGCLVGVPSAELFLVHELRDRSAERALAALRETTARIFGEQPRRVSPHVYWWRDGQFQKLEQAIPGELREILRELDRGDDPATLSTFAGWSRDGRSVLTIDHAGDPLATITAGTLRVLDAESGEERARIAFSGALDDQLDALDQLGFSVGRGAPLSSDASGVRVSPQPIVPGEPEVRSPSAEVEAFTFVDPSAPSRSARFERPLSVDGRANPRASRVALGFPRADRRALWVVPDERAITT